MKRKRVKGGHHSYPGVVLPCGCSAFRKTGGSQKQEALILKDGDRVCRCGKRWRLGWVHIRELRPLKGRGRGK